MVSWVGLMLASLIAQQPSERRQDVPLAQFSIDNPNFACSLEDGGMAGFGVDYHGNHRLIRVARYGNNPVDFITTDTVRRVTTFERDGVRTWEISFEGSAHSSEGLPGGRSVTGLATDASVIGLITVRLESNRFSAALDVRAGEVRMVSDHCVIGPPSQHLVIMESGS